MAIPKEPRQLMINIMYLVLTAMLALNVSAEIFNAFKVIDHGLEESNQTVDKTNAQRVEAIKTAAKKDEETFQKYVDRIPQVQSLQSDFSSYIDGITSHMIETSGGYDEEGNLKGKKNKDVTTRYLVDEGTGAELQARIEKLHDEFIALVDEEDRAEFSIPLGIDDESWKESANKPKSWAEFNFRQMPLQAVLPMFTKFKNDAKQSEAEVLNYFQKKVGGEEIVFDAFQVVASPKKSYIIKGEKFEADIFLSAASKNVDGLSIAVNGRNLPIKDGVAKFETAANSTGIKKYRAVASLTNAVTGNTESYDAEFEYEVGERSVSVSADKMNVFYIGVDNPITVAAAGISSNELRVSGTGGGITVTSKGGPSYNVRVTTQGDAKINVSGGGLQATSYPFRVKRIPDPVAKIGQKKGGSFGTGEIRAQQGVYADLENFDFEARCNILSYNFVYMPKRDDPRTVNNRGGKFSGDASALLRSVKPGDRISFEEVKAKCPGDKVSREINSMIFTIR